MNDSQSTQQQTGSVAPPTQNPQTNASGGLQPVGDSTTGATNQDSLLPQNGGSLQVELATGSMSSRTLASPTGPQNSSISLWIPGIGLMVLVVVVVLLINKYASRITPAVTEAADQLTATTYGVGSPNPSPTQKSSKPKQRKKKKKGRR